MASASYIQLICSSSISIYLSAFGLYVKEWSKGCDLFSPSYIFQFLGSFSDTIRLHRLHYERCKRKPGVDRTTVLDPIFVLGRHNMELIHLAYEKFQWKALVKMVECG